MKNDTFEVLKSKEIAALEFDPLVRANSISVLNSLNLSSFSSCWA